MEPLIAARGPRPSDESRVSRWLSGVSLLVLLAACANVANLLLARGIQQRDETGVRLALGISRRRLVGERAVESLMLALGGALLALLVATRIGNAARAILFLDIEWIDRGIDARVVGFTLAAALASAVAAGIVPALQSTAGDLRNWFAGGVAHGGRARLRTSLMVLQCTLLVVTAAVRAGIRALEPRIDWVAVRLLRDMIAPQTRSWRIGATMFSAFGGLALMVCAVGLYGILGFEVAQRRREMGIRSALGAAPARLARMIVVRGMVPTAMGIVLGLTAVAALGGRLEPLLYGTSSRDPFVFLLAGATLLGVGLLAVALPARRAGRLDPAHELRNGR